MAQLKMRVAAIVCTPPILESVTNLGDKQFELVWNYNGVDYSSDPGVDVRIYISQDDINYELVPGAIIYPQTSKIIDLQDHMWEFFYFKIRVFSFPCEVFSNVIMIPL